VIVVFKDDVKPFSWSPRSLSGGLVILCLPGESLLDIDFHAWQQRFGDRDLLSIPVKRSSWIRDI
jgi:hypothetical protein